MLGISIYPDKASQQEIFDYIELASKYGFGRIFTCLLSVDGDRDQIVKEFEQIISFANAREMEVYLDVAPHVFDELGIKHGDLQFFSKLGASGIRLDQSFNGSVEASMSYNPYDLNVEINMSQDVHTLNIILDFKPKPGKIIGCHNFYPQRYTGLNFEHFVSTSMRFKEHGVRSAAFVSSADAKIGPWPIMDGLCTLEMHRDLAITTQVKHHYALGLIDDIIIGNMFASEQELKAISEIERGLIDFDIELINPSELEQKIIFEHEHFNRGDINDYMVRSTMCRVTHKAEDNAPHDTSKVLKRGTVIIGNNDFGQYKNELQIIKNEIIDENLARNVVGKISDDELFLLDLLEPWQHFKFTNKIN
ncbi:MupG family TIM beta-alpha barrel fold protein [Mollicutes bacterium LVI A0078]|nr:MupG family TIM beta-alpha barrel fold protein [Mollicutes bacterium LVI A0075]WOO91617.1 MupG family TIM beta-alpha barrel fold protein [Mollicutes bacterium LVI A0078]